MDKIDIDGETLAKFKDIVSKSQTRELSGSIKLSNTKVVDIAIRGTGTSSEVRLPKDCIECFHTHPAPPKQGLISVPSGTDLLVAYNAKPGTRQWLATNDGLWIYWRAPNETSNILEFFKSFNEPHPVTLNRMIVDWCMDGSITYSSYMQYVEKQLSIKILFYSFD